MRYSLFVVRQIVFLMYRLGVHGLSEAEAGLVRAYVALASTGLREPWTFAGDGQCDALLADDAPEAAALASRRRGARVLGFVGDTRLGWADMLPRPLRIDEFERWLNRIGERLAPATAAAAPSTAKEVHFRLRRWPPAELLRSQPDRTRMAAALSRQALNAAGLARATGLDEGECGRFMQLLQGFQLLQAARPVPSTMVASAPAPVGWTLLRSIRRRLGLSA